LSDDCNENQLVDKDEIAQGTADDCNNNGIPDECDVPDCQPIDVVFILDTSGSMCPRFNHDFWNPPLCPALLDALAQVDQDVCVRSEIYKLADDDECIASQKCECCTDTVANVFCPGEYCDELTVCVTDDQNRENWAAAAKVVAANKDWGPGPRLIIPVSDEGPLCGDDYNPPGQTDAGAIDAAAPVLESHWCVAVPIVADFDYLPDLARELAASSAPGGTFFTIEDETLPEQLAEFMRGLCAKDCNENVIPDVCDIESETSADCEGNGIPDECEDQTDCNNNGKRDACDLYTGTSLDCNDNEVPDECDTDCQPNTVADECDLYTNPVAFSGASFPAATTAVNVRDVLASASTPCGRRIKLDLDMDGDADVISANDTSSTDSVTALVNGGTGVLAVAQTVAYAYGDNPRALAAGDFDHDGDLDVAIARWIAPGEINILENLGNDGAVWAKFAAPTSVPLEPGSDRPQAIQAADLDGDGDLDLVTANFTGNTLSVLYNDGDGGFASANNSPFSAGGEANDVAVGDLDADGLPDLAVAAGWDHSVNVLINTTISGDQYTTFGAPEEFPVSPGVEPERLALADVNADEYLDVVAVTTGDLVVLTNLGEDYSGWLGLEESFGLSGAGNLLYDVVAADVNSDYHADVVAVDRNQHRLIVFYGDGTSAFHLAEEAVVENHPENVDVSMLDADDDVDFVVASWSGKKVRVFLNATSPPTSVDLDDDGIPDECGGCELAERPTAGPQACDEAHCSAYEDGCACGNASSCVNGVCTCTGSGDCRGTADCLDGVCYVPKNVYLSLVPGTGPGTTAAIRVSTEYLSDYVPGVGGPWDEHPYVGMECTAKWVGEPEIISEASGTDGYTDEPSFTVAALQCTPYYTDWSQYSTIDVYGDLIAPDAVYAVQAIPQCASTTDEEVYSAPLPQDLQMGRRGRTLPGSAGQLSSSACGGWNRGFR
jgi:hypothetical protein